MNTETKLTAMRDLIQDDVGQRGLRTDPTSNLITATTDDFAAACRSVAETRGACLWVVTGFFIPTGNPPCGETDGPLGALFLARALPQVGVNVVLLTDAFCVPALEAGLKAADLGSTIPLITLPASSSGYSILSTQYSVPQPTHLVALERVGPNRSGICHTMRGRDITALMSPAHHLFETASDRGLRTIGIGDGGNEIGMGKLDEDIIRRNIPNGGQVACRVATDHLIVAGVSNWGAYALATGVALLKGQRLDAELFDIEKERELLRVMVEAGPLVDGVTGQPSVSVDGLPFELYAEPLRQLVKIKS